MICANRHKPAGRPIYRNTAIVQLRGVLILTPLQYAIAHVTAIAAALLLIRSIGIGREILDPRRPDRSSSEKALQAPRSPHLLPNLGQPCSIIRQDQDCSQAPRPVGLPISTHLGRRIEYDTAVS
nr:hypothetical protein CFP56_20981 [Quercus suber]